MTVQSLIFRFSFLAFNLAIQVAGAPFSSNSSLALATKPHVSRADISPIEGVLCTSNTKPHCPAIPNGFGIAYDIWIPELLGFDGDVNHCGQPLLESVRAQTTGCATVSSWNCKKWFRNETQTWGIRLLFDTTVFCLKGNIQKAIWDATRPQLENYCTEHDWFARWDPWWDTKFCPLAGR